MTTSWTLRRQYPRSFTINRSVIGSRLDYYGLHSDIRQVTEMTAKEFWVVGNPSRPLITVDVWIIMVQKMVFMCDLLF